MTQTVNANRMSDNGNDLTLSGNSNRGGMVEVASTRAAQEVQAAMVIAKRYPRDETASINRIMQACKRKTLAEQSLYAYPKGNTTVTGPSIRMAEALAQNWGNVDFGIIELEQRNGESTVMSYAWDLETNTRQTKIFTVKHERHTRSGSYALKDPREIYEMTANQGARRLRACILGIIPGDVVDSAVAECEKTMAGNNAEPLIDRIRKMVSAFLSEFNVTQEMLEKRLGHRVDVTAEPELVNLKKVFRSLKDGMASVPDFFEQADAPQTDLDERLANAGKGGSGAAAPKQTNPPAAEPRRPGESEEDYLRRLSIKDEDQREPFPGTDELIDNQHKDEDTTTRSQPAGSLEDLTDWSTFSRLMDDEAKKQHIDIEVADGGMKLALLVIQKKGKPEQTSVDWRQRHLAAARAGKFDWAKGRIL